MAIVPLIALLAAAAGPDRATQIDHAISVGRLEQARLMLSDSAIANDRSARIERLRADLDFASGRSEQALNRYYVLLVASPTDARLLERAAISALSAGDLVRARTFVERAVAVPDATWRAWNAKAVLADLENDFSVADQAYDRALAMAPDQVELLNNVGWSRLLRGDWAGAETMLQRAVLQPGATRRMANNLELARSASAEMLPRRRPQESDRAFAARLNDAGIAARMRGDRMRAIAAFSQAIEARGSWYERAAKNLEAAKAEQ